LSQSAPPQHYQTPLTTLQLGALPAAMNLVKPTPSGFTSTRDIAETELLTLDSLKNIDRYKMRIVGEHTSLSDSLI